MSCNWSRMQYTICSNKAVHGMLLVCVVPLGDLFLYCSKALYRLSKFSGACCERERDATRRAISMTANYTTNWMNTRALLPLIHSLTKIHSFPSISISDALVIMIICFERKHRLKRLTKQRRPFRFSSLPLFSSARFLTLLALLALLLLSLPETRASWESKSCGFYFIDSQFLSC